MSGFDVVRDWGAIATILILLIGCAWPLGGYMAKVFEGKRTVLSPVLQPLERGCYRLCGVDERREMSWVIYAWALLAFQFVGFLVLYIVLRSQGVLPLNPQNMSGMEPRLAFNTTVSFVSNTNWQAYSGEVSLSYFSQMVGLTVQNFVSAATGIAVLVALVRGFVRRSGREIGNFWVDLVRSIVYILLPLSVVGALVLVALGVPQTFDGAVTAQTLTGGIQQIPLGPAASQIIIKQLGTNGGGFFGVNSAHPFENPTIWTNTIEVVSILLIPVAMTFMFGRLVGNIRQGLTLFGAMMVLLVVGLVITTAAERSGNPLIDEPAVSASVEVNGASAPGGNMEGKEVRFGIPQSTAWAVITTAASNGSVNAMHDSFTPIGGAIPLINIATGEVIFGGVGSGLYGMVFYAVMAMFVAGLMVGRTPEYLGKKIESFEMKMAMIALLICPLLILGMTAIATVGSAALSSRANGGPHGLTEMLYAFASGAGNNGSAFGGLSVNTAFYNIMIGLAMFFGRFFLIIPALAMAGSLVKKHHVASTDGTLPTTGFLWISMLVGVVVVVGALTFLPGFALGPLVEHVFMQDGVTFPTP